MFTVITFLGNPGREYVKTRHNFAWMLADYMVKDSPTWTTKANALHTRVVFGGNAITMIKPQTFMNESGNPTRKILDFYGIEPHLMLVVHDDLETPFGSIRYKQSGGLGGHNGLRSIEQHCGKSWARIKLGIGRPPHGSVSNFVLSRFNNQEEIVLPLILEKAADLIEEILNQQQKNECEIKVV